MFLFNTKRSKCYRRRKYLVIFIDELDETKKEYYPVQMNIKKDPVSVYQEVQCILC